MKDASGLGRIGYLTESGDRGVGFNLQMRMYRWSLQSSRSKTTYGISPTPPSTMRIKYYCVSTSGDEGHLVCAHHTY